MFPQASPVHTAVRSLLRRLDLDVVRHLDTADLRRRRAQLIQSQGITMLFDVGANVGQYALAMRGLGYRGKIVSFEPLPDAYQVLSDVASHDADWSVVNCALGDRAGEQTLLVGEDPQTSSLLDPLPALVEAAPVCRPARSEVVRVETLGSEIDRLVAPDDRLFVKIDVQGFEESVISGAGERMDRIEGFQIEMALMPLYGGQRPIDAVMHDLREMGFNPVLLEPGFSDPATGRLLEVDGVFFRDARA